MCPIIKFNRKLIFRQVSGAFNGQVTSTGLMHEFHFYVSLFLMFCNPSPQIRVLNIRWPMLHFSTCSCTGGILCWRLTLHPTFILCIEKMFSLWTLEIYGLAEFRFIYTFSQSENICVPHTSWTAAAQAVRGSPVCGPCLVNRWQLISLISDESFRFC